MCFLSNCSNFSLICVISQHFCGQKLSGNELEVASSQMRLPAKVVRSIVNEHNYQSLWVRNFYFLESCPNLPFLLVRKLFFLSQLEYFIPFPP